MMIKLELYAHRRDFQDTKIRYYALITHAKIVKLIRHTKAIIILGSIISTPSLYNLIYAILYGIQTKCLIESDLQDIQSTHI